MQCPAKKFDYKLTKRTVTDLLFQLKYLMYSDHSTFYSKVLNFHWRLQTSFDVSLMIQRQTSQLSITIDKSIRKKTKTTEHSKIFQCNSIFQHLIAVSLFNKCLSL